MMSNPSDGAQPEDLTLADARPLIAAADHAYRQGDWRRFDDIFRRRLMRFDVLCDVLGAWNEALTLALPACDGPYPAGDTIDPAYYRLVVARSLKHLGRSAESRVAYLDGLRESALSRDPETAMCVNNFLTLLIWRGELNAAEVLADVNVRALSWIPDERRLRWQVEHGMSSLAYLRMLQGRTEAATALFDRSERAWDGYEGERDWTWDYYPYYRSEVILLSDRSAHDDALASIDPLLALAKERGWPEPACRGHIQAAAICTDRAAHDRDAGELTRARRHLEEARAISIGMRVPDVAIAHNLTGLRAELTARQIGMAHSFDLDFTNSVLDEVERTIRASGLKLALPDLIAAKGAVAMINIGPDIAQDRFAQAIAECRAQGNGLAPLSPRSFVCWLGDEIGIEKPPANAGEVNGLIELIGADLTTDAMLARLDQVAAMGSDPKPA